MSAYSFSFLIDDDNMASLAVNSSALHLRIGRERLIRADANAVLRAENNLRILRYVCPFDTWGSSYVKE